MKQLPYVLAGLIALAGCSDRREQRMVTTTQRADLTLPDTVALRDTSVTTSPRNEPSVSPVEQATNSDTAPRSTSAIAQRYPARTKTRARPVKPAPDTSVQAYAPNRGSDSARPPERIVSDTAREYPDTAGARSDTAGIARGDTIHSAEPLADSARRPPSDTLAVTLPDTAGADTASTPVADTMVASPPAVPTAARSSAAALASRTLPSGTQIHAALNDSISSRRDTVGQQVAAHVMENVVGPDGKTLIAAGTPVRFTITRLRSARSKNSQGRLALRADGIALNGQLRKVKAEVRPIPRELRGRGVTAGEAAKVGGGAAAGAVLGRVIGGSTRGAVIGGVAGAAAGAVVATQTATRDVVVKAKTPVVLVLTEPLVTP